MWQNANIWKKAIPVVMFIVLGVGIALYLGAKPEETQGSYSKGDLMRSLSITPMPQKTKAPDFVLKNLEGRDVELSDLQGNIVMLSFWATW